MLRRYIRRKRYILSCGWYRNLLGAYVDSHAIMVVSRWALMTMSDKEFAQICPYFQNTTNRNGGT